MSMKVSSLEAKMEASLEMVRVTVAQNEEDLTRGTGPFQHPANRAFAFRSLIEYTLRHDMDNLLADGSLIPQSKLDLATQIFAEATEKHVWDPRQIVLSPDRKVQGLCESHKIAAERAIAAAARALAAAAEKTTL